MKKGFVYTISLIVMISVLMYFLIYYNYHITDNYNFVIKSTKPVKINYVVDDITYSLNSLLGTSVDLDLNNNLKINIKDNFTKDYNLDYFEYFFENNYAEKSNIDLDLEFFDFSNNDYNIYFSNNLIYNYNKNSKFITIYNIHNIDELDINIYVKDVNYIQQWTYSSTGKYVKINVYDETGLINSSDGYINNVLCNSNTYKIFVSTNDNNVILDLCDIFYIKENSNTDVDFNLSLIENSYTDDIFAYYDVNVFLQIYDFNYNNHLIIDKIRH